jgi:hypothetical protein
MKNHVKILFITLLLATGAQLTAMQKPAESQQSAIQKFSNWLANWTSGKSAPQAAPEGFDSLPGDVRRIIVQEVIALSPSLEKAAEDLRSLSQLKSFNKVVNDDTFTQQLIKKLAAKFYKSEFSVALELGTASATKWLRNLIQKNNAEIVRIARSALKNAIESNTQVDDNEKKIAFLLAAGIDPNYRETTLEDTFLTEAVKKNKPNIVRILLKAGANPNEIAQPYTECATDLLFANDADIPLSTLDHALLVGNKEIIKMLKEKGAKSTKDIWATICNVQ